VSSSQVPSTGHGVPDPSQAAHDVAEGLSRVGQTVADQVKPRLRGWIHAGVAPFVLVAVYHRGRWSPRTAAVLRRMDHTNIFLIIAGTYTPLAVLMLNERTARILLLVVWGGALVGALARIFWLQAPRWVYVPSYVALGLVAVGYIPSFARSGGPAVAWLVLAGGVAYIAGAVVYGTKRPNPSPRWFGFHEVFHALTVVAFACHYVAVSIATYRLR